MKFIKPLAQYLAHCIIASPLLVVKALNQGDTVTNVRQSQKFYYIDSLRSL